MAGTPYTKVVCDIYEQSYNDTTISSDDVTNGFVTVSGWLVHADASGNGDAGIYRSRIYLEGVEATITDMSNNSPDLHIFLSDTLTLGERIEMYIPTTTGSLIGNTATGKLTRPSKQIGINYTVTSNEVKTAGLGTKAKHTYTFAGDGSFSLALEKADSTLLKDLKEARKNDKYLSVVVKDTHGAADEYRIFNAGVLTNYGDEVVNVDGERGLVRETFDFGFMPEVEVSTA